MTRARNVRFGAEDGGVGPAKPGLTSRYGPRGSQVQRSMAPVIRLLKLAGQADPGALPAAVQARLRYTAPLPARRGRPLSAYPMPVLEAIQRAALADARLIRE